VTRDSAQKLVDKVSEDWFLAKHSGKRSLGVEQKVEVCSDGAGAVENESERSCFIGATAHISAEERGRLPVFLLVPGTAFADDITVLDSQAVGWEKKVSGPF
jgi:hypothetical protein